MMATKKKSTQPQRARKATQPVAGKSKGKARAPAAPHADRMERLDAVIEHIKKRKQQHREDAHAPGLCAKAAAVASVLAGLVEAEVDRGSVLDDLNDLILRIPERTLLACVPEDVPLPPRHDVAGLRALAYALNRAAPEGGKRGRPKDDSTELLGAAVTLLRDIGFSRAARRARELGLKGVTGRSLSAAAKRFVSK